MRRPSLLFVVGVLVALVAIALAGVVIFRPKTNESFAYTKAIAKTAMAGNLKTTLLACQTDKAGKPKTKSCVANQYWTEQSPSGYWQLSYAQTSPQTDKKWSLEDGGQFYVWSKKGKCLKQTSRKSPDINVSELFSVLKRDKIFNESGPTQGRYKVEFQNKKLPPIFYTKGKNGELTSISRYMATDRQLTTIAFQPLKKSVRSQADSKLCK